MIKYDPLVERIVARARQRAHEGQIKYGCTMGDASMDKVSAIRNTQEELWDAIVYLERLVEELAPRETLMKCECASCQRK
jgi:hypothetical protein